MSAFWGGVVTCALVMFMLFVGILDIYGKTVTHACMQVYGSETREFALCVYEMDHKLRDRP